MTDSSEGRSSYRPSGRFESANLFIHGGILFGVALLLAVGLAWAVRIDGYALGYIWIPPVAILSSLVRRAVAYANCRNPVVGAGLGLAAGLFALAGTYHLDQCARWGIAWERVDRLPGYIPFRMETDGLWWPDGRMPCLEAMPAQQGVDPYGAPRVTDHVHWLVFLAEILVLVGIPTGAGWVRASRPFSERANRWFARDLLTLTRESAARLQQALGDGTLTEWARTALATTFTHEPHATVTVWYCPRATEGDEPEPDVYVSLGGRPFLLTPEEAAGVATAVPSLTDLAQPLSNRYVTRDDGNPSAARLLRIPGANVGRAKKRSVIYLGRVGMYAVTFSPLLVLLVFAGLAFLLHLLFEALGVPNEVLVAIFGVAAITLLILIRRWNDPNHDLGWRFLVRYYRRVIETEAAARDDALFSPDAPGVIYVEMIPRRAWADTQTHRNECEGGLLLLDLDRRTMWFEGDRYRYVVPFESVVRWSLEEVVMGNVQKGTTAGFFAVIFVVRTADGDRELPLCPLAGVPGSNRWERTSAFYDRVTPLLGEPVALSPASPPRAAHTPG